jgi:hypothetical protein
MDTDREMIKAIDVSSGILIVVQASLVRNCAIPDVRE